MIDQLRQLTSLNPGQALGAILSELQAMRAEIRGLRAERPVESRPETRKVAYLLSSLGRSSLQVPVELHITELLLSGDTSGRAILSLGGKQWGIQVPAGWTLQLTFGEGLWVTKNDSITYTPPPNAGTWDVVIVGKMAAPSMRGASQRT